MKIIIGSDHGGFELKESLKKHLIKQGYDVSDVGTDSLTNVDYPIYAKKVAEKVISDKENVGILICGTGLGMCMAANKIKGIRAALCYNESSAKLAKEHNNANILCLGGREFTEEIARRITKTFLESPFSNEEKHKRRIKEISDLEK